MRLELRYVERYKERKQYECLEEIHKEEIIDHLAKLVVSDEKDEAAISFDVLMYGLMLSVMTGGKNLNKMDFDEKDRAEFELREGDLLVCEGGEIGRCAVWHNELQPCFFQKALHRVRCNHQIILPDYLAWWFRYNCDYGGFSALAGAKATIAHLPGAKLKQLQVAVPPMELQEQFAVFVAQTDKSKVAVQKALDEAQLLFDSLMQEYFG